MKKHIVLVSMSAALAFGSAAVYAGSFDYLSNQSAGYFMNTSKTASTADAEIVPYNPAGTALMEKGFYFDLSNQTLLKFYSNTEKDVLDDTYEQTDPTYFLPNLFAVYNFGRLGAGSLAVYGQAGIAAGGGALNYPDGTVGSNAYLLSAASAVATRLSAYSTGIESTSSSMEASSIYYGLGLGLAYSVLDDRVSASAGLRYTMAKRSAKIEGSMDFYTALFGGAWSIDIVDEYEYDAQGITPIFGLDVRPVDKLTLGVRYEMETDLRFKYDVKDLSADSTSSVAATQTIADALAAQLDNDGAKADQNLPQILSVGAEYQATSALAVAASTTVYFLGDADMDGLEDYFGTGYDVNVSAKYKVAAPLLLGCTLQYTEMAVKKSYFEDNLLSGGANPALDSITMGIGAQYTVIQNLDFLVSTAWVHYFPVDFESGAMDITYEKDVVNLCLGVKYKM